MAEEWHILQANYYIRQIRRSKTHDSNTVAAAKCRKRQLAKKAYVDILILSVNLTIITFVYSIELMCH